MKFYVGDKHTEFEKTRILTNDIRRGSRVDQNGKNGAKERHKIHLYMINR